MKPGPDIQAKLMARDPANGFYARRPEGCPCNPGFQYQSAENLGQSLDERLDKLLGQSLEEWEAQAAQDVVRSRWLDSMTRAEASAITKRFYARNPNPEIKSFDDCDDDDDRKIYSVWLYSQTEAEAYAFRYLRRVKRRALEEKKADKEGRVLREYVPVQTEDGHRAKTAKRAATFRAKQKATETPEQKAERTEKERLRKAAQRAAAKTEISASLSLSLLAEKLPK